MRPVAEELAKRGFRCHEPLQRRSGKTKLTVAVHVCDLQDFMADLPGDSVVVGHSWGAMLTLCWACEHAPNSRLVLVGCGTFDTASRAEMIRILNERMDDGTKRALQKFDEIDLSDEQLAKAGRLVDDAYNFDAVEDFAETDVDSIGYKQTWMDMLSKQKAGVYPAAFSTISDPVTMIHGDHDPHPGSMIFANLRQYIPHLEYRELSECGHYPWRERHAREAFLGELEAIHAK